MNNRYRFEINIKYIDIKILNIYKYRLKYVYKKKIKI